MLKQLRFRKSDQSRRPGDRIKERLRAWTGSRHRNGDRRRPIQRHHYGLPPFRGAWEAGWWQWRLACWACWWPRKVCNGYTGEVSLYKLIHSRLNQIQ